MTYNIAPGPPLTTPAHLLEGLDRQLGMLGAAVSVGERQWACATTLVPDLPGYERRMYSIAPPEGSGSVTALLPSSHANV